ncbi:GNAT family N-acetyltransferase [Paenibacillus senegalensis]|uniref:GNAT family N-acetyltransferase n=1 Tax=Paenibacillus senegalensis TaxID=1465766 RepID=UPI000288FBD7|nr:GNAT family protein [Paenibacillus senegalensis]
MQYSIWQGHTIRLRAMEPEDADWFHRFIQDDEVTQHIQQIDFPHSKETVRRQIEHEETRNDHAYQWIAENREGTRIGLIFTYDCDPRAGTFSYGIALHRERWGKGYAVEMIKLVLVFYFFELRYQKVNAKVYSFNDRGIRLHAKLGFTKEGALRRMVYTSGQYHDLLCYGMTREEFEAIFPG